MKIAIFWGLIAVWVLPFIGAAIYVSREKLVALATPGLRSILILFSKEAREEIAFLKERESEVGRSKSELERSRKALLKSLKIERKLLQQVQHSFDLQDSLDDDAGHDKKFEKKAEARRMKSTALAKKLQLQVENSNALFAEVEVREHGYLIVHSKMRNEINVERVKKLVSQSHECVIEKSKRKISQIEQKVEKLEQYASRKMEPAPLDPKLQEQTARMDSLIGKILGKIQVVETAIETIENKLISLDPSIDRAFGRLSKALNVAKDLSKPLLADEESLNDKLVAMQRKLENAVDKSYLEEMPEEARERHVAKVEAAYGPRIEALKNALTVVRIRNAQLEHSLFRFELLVRRLLVLKLLIVATADSSIDSASEYKSLVNNFCTEMGKLFPRTTENEGDAERTQAAKKRENVDHQSMHDRVVALETRVFAGYIRLAKDASRADTKMLKENLNRLSMSLTIEWCDQKVHQKKWADICEGAKRKKLELAEIIASQRRDESADLVSHLELCSQVISTTLTCLDQVG